MYCSKCGKELPNGVNYCPSCGNPVGAVADSEKEKKSFGKKKLVMIAGMVLVAIAVPLCIWAVGRNQSQNKEKASTEITDSNQTVVQTDAAGTQDSNSEFCVSAANGETLTVTPGFSQVMCSCNYNSNERSDASILIPSLESYSDGIYTMNEETCEDGYYQRTFSSSSATSKNFLADYVESLIHYDFIVGYTAEISSDHTVYFLYYNGNITHGADDWLNTEYDMSVGYYNSISGSQILFRYPSEVGFAFEGDKQTYYSSATTETEYTNEGGESKFKVAGWGEESGDYIGISFNNDTYKKGDIITLDELVTQRSAGDSALCRATIYGPLISGDPVVGIMGSDEFQAGEIEILEKSDSIIVIHYYFEVPSNSSVYVLEGIAAAKATAEVTRDSGETSNDCDGTDSYFKVDDETTCSVCGGTGKTQCHTCGGDGFLQCPNCNGTGTYYDNILGMTKTCGRCNGSGKIPCTNSQCVNGQVTCGSCNGEANRE